MVVCLCGRNVMDALKSGAPLKIRVVMEIFWVLKFDEKRNTKIIWNMKQKRTQNKQNSLTLFIEQR